MWLLRYGGAVPLVLMVAPFPWLPFAKAWRWRFVPLALLLASFTTAGVSLSVGVRPALESTSALLLFASVITQALATLSLRPWAATPGGGAGVTRLFNGPSVSEDERRPLPRRQRIVIVCAAISTVALAMYAQSRLLAWYPPPGAPISRTGPAGFAIEIDIASAHLQVTNNSAQGWSACEMGIGQKARYRTVFSLAPHRTVTLPYDLFFDAERQVVSHGYWQARETLNVACREDGGRPHFAFFN